MKKKTLILKLVPFFMMVSISIPSDSWGLCPSEEGEPCGIRINCECDPGLLCVLKNPEDVDSTGFCQPPGTPAPSSSMRLYAPPDGIDELASTTVFRWSRSDKSTVQEYELVFTEDQGSGPLFNEGPVVKRFRTTDTQLAVRLGDHLTPNITYFWRVFALNEIERVVDASQEFTLLFPRDSRDYTVITGLVMSDLNQARLLGARVAVSSLSHYVTQAEGGSSIGRQERDQDYEITAETRDRNGNPVPGPISLNFQAEGHETTAISVPSTRGEISVEDVVMVSTADSDGDGIRDKVEMDSQCLDENDADTDDDGIGDGDEDKNKDGIIDEGETDPCNAADPNVGARALPAIIIPLLQED